MNSPYSTCFNSNNQPGIWKSFEKINSSFLLGDASCKAGSSGCTAQSHPDESAPIASLIAATAFILLSAFTDIPLVYLAPVFALVFGAFVTETLSAASDSPEEPESVCRPLVRFRGIDKVYHHDTAVQVGPNVTDRKKACH